jgi:hypothetical protein
VPHRRRLPQRAAASDLAELPNNRKAFQHTKSLPNKRKGPTPRRKDARFTPQQAEDALRVAPVNQIERRFQPKVPLTTRIGNSGPKRKHHSASPPTPRGPGSPHCKQKTLPSGSGSIKSSRDSRPKYRSRPESELRPRSGKRPPPNPEGQVHPTASRRRFRMAPGQSYRAETPAQSTAHDPNRNFKPDLGNDPRRIPEGQVHPTASRTRLSDGLVNEDLQEPDPKVPVTKPLREKALHSRTSCYAEDPIAQPATPTPLKLLRCRRDFDAKPSDLPVPHCGPPTLSR